MQRRRRQPGLWRRQPLSSQVDATSTITVNCTKNTAYQVGLNAGATSGATIAQRLMANGANTMLYNLYTNTTRTNVWGNTSGTWATGTGVGLATAQPIHSLWTGGQRPDNTAPPSATTRKAR